MPIGQVNFQTNRAYSFNNPKNPSFCAGAKEMKEFYGFSYGKSNVSVIAEKFISKIKNAGTQEALKTELTKIYQSGENIEKKVDIFLAKVENELAKQQLADFRYKSLVKKMNSIIKEFHADRAKATQKPSGRSLNLVT